MFHIIMILKTIYMTCSWIQNDNTHVLFKNDNDDLETAQNNKIQHIIRN